MPFASDAFSGSAGAVLETYSANWTKVSGDDGDVVSIGASSGYITTTTSIGFQAHIYNAAQATNADYDVEGTYLIAAGGDLPPAIAGRIVSASDSSCYFVTWLGGGTWGLYRHTGGGSNTSLGTYVGDSPNGVQRTVTLRFSGTTITVLIGGVSRISVTDATYSAKGYAGVVQYFGTVTDSANLRNWSATDAAGGSTYNLSASDAVTATDAATQQLTAPAAATDAASAADSASNLGVLTRSASDAATATDSATSASAVNSAATDAIAAADAATQLAVLPAAASDAAAVTDAATNLGVLTRAATDAAAASDAATGLRVTLGSASDAVTATDTAAQVSAANVTATDAISAADAATVQAVLAGIVSDGFSATDAATLLAGIYNLTAADVLSLLDAALADGGVQYARAPQGAGQDLIYPAGHRSPVISGNRPGNINMARPANRGGRRT